MDKFVAMADRMAGDKKPPTNLNAVLKNRFKPFCAHIASLIKKAKEDADWKVDQADHQALQKLFSDMVKDCSKWKLKNDTHELWIEMLGLAHNYPWPPADYLKSLATPVSRGFRKGDAVMKLRPQVRVKYS